MYEDEEDAYLPHPKPQEILNCAFQAWYPQYKSSTIPSLVLAIPSVVVDYLKEDGMFMPEDSTFTDSELEWSGQAEEPTDDGKRFQRMFEDEKFKSFLLNVKEGISSLGGKVFPKLNWSSPRDSAWIALNNSLCCQSTNDIFILLKSSEFITHDLTNPFLLPCETINTKQIDHHLVLRKWADLNPANEFRIFVFQHRIVAISQRSEQYAKHVNEHRQNIVHNIVNFFKTKIKPRFPEDSFTFDVYLPDFESAVVLIDFNAWCGATDGLLFQWKDIASLCKGTQLEATPLIDGIAFRTSPEEGASHGTSLQQYAFPLDIQHLSTGEDTSKLIDLMKLQQAQSTTPIDSDGD